MCNYTPPEIALTETLPRREEIFPMQEQTQGPARRGTQKPAAVILAECLAEAGAGMAAPVFIP